MPLVVVVLQQLSVTPTTSIPQIIIIHRQRRPVYSERLWLESKESAGNVESNFVAAILKHIIILKYSFIKGSKTDFPLLRPLDTLRLDKLL